MRRIDFFEQKGVQWTTEALMFTTITLVLLNSEPEFAGITKAMSHDVLNFGANMTQFRASYELMRKSLIFINTRSESNLRNEADRVLFERIKKDFDMGEFIQFVKRIRSNNLDHNLARQYLKKLARDLHITNAKLKSFISLAGKFPNLPSKQQIDTLYKMRNYATINYRQSEFATALSNVYDGYVNRYGNDERYTQQQNSKSERNEQLAGMALIGAILAGTYKMTKFLTGLRKPRKESWAKRIAGKAEHRGFDDQFRH